MVRDSTPRLTVLITSVPLRRYLLLGPALAILLAAAATLWRVKRSQELPPELENALAGRPVLIRDGLVLVRIIYTFAGYGGQASRTPLIWLGFIALASILLTAASGHR